MTTSEQIITGIVFVLAGAALVISIRSFMNRGFLFNNSEFYASKEERETMDKRPHYRQSAIVFLLLSIIFILVGLSIILHDSRILLLEVPVALGAVIYAIVSSARTGK